jgi:hypothetical protein
MALSSKKLISIIARMDPAAYDHFWPRFRGVGAHRRFSAAAGPSPWPMAPAEAGAAMARNMLHTRWLESKRGERTRAADTDLDIWCPLGRELREILVPLFGDYDEERPRPNWAEGFYLGLAAELARARETLIPDSPMMPVIEQGINHALIGLEKSQGCNPTNFNF